MDGSPAAGPHVTWPAIEMARVASVLGGVMPKGNDANTVRSHPPNLLVLGASGHVAQAFLRRLGGRRAQFGRLVLLDRNEHVRKDRFLEHGRLRYEFVRQRLRWPDDGSYRELLRRYEIDIVLDLTDMDTLPVLAATDAAGVSYVNTALNDANRRVPEMVAAVHPTREEPRQAPHILSSGMNPGAVNVWVSHGVDRYGVPDEIVHFEYDTSMAVDRWRPLITWSRREFLTETVWEPTGLVVDGRLKMLRANALAYREDMRSIMEPVVPLPSYPRGFLVLHEENVKLGQALGVSSKYLYAIHPRTMAYLVRRWRETGRVKISDLHVGDNTTIPLEGSDTIGVCLEYPGRRVYYLHSLANSAVIGTNATCTQVAVGVYAALITLLHEQLSPRIYFATDLYETVYPHVLFSNLRVEHFFFEKRKRSWELRQHVPELHPRFPITEEQVVI